MEQYQALKVTELKSLIKKRNINAKNLKLKKEFINALVEYDKQEELNRKENEEAELGHLDKQQLLDSDFNSLDKVENEPISSLNAEEAESEETTSIEEDDSKDIEEPEYDNEQTEENGVIQNNRSEDTIEEIENDETINEVTEEPRIHNNYKRTQPNSHVSVNTEVRPKKTTTPQIRYEEEIRKQNKSKKVGRSQNIFTDIYNLMKDLLTIFILLSVVLPAWMYSRL